MYHVPKGPYADIMYPAEAGIARCLQQSYLPLMTDTSRIDELEIRVAHQEQTIEDLNSAITAQWKIIDKLERELSRLTDRVSSAEDSLADAPPAHQPPPHY